MAQEEEMVRGFLEARGFDVERFSKEEMRSGRTPDFRVFKDSQLAFFCEVKTIQKDGWLDSKLAAIDVGELAGGERADPVFNRLTYHVHDSVGQFDAVNPHLDVPNVLAHVNHDEGCGFNDLIGILTGEFMTDDDGAHPIYVKFSSGRIRTEKEKIHLHIWLDDYKPMRLLFTQTHADHHGRLCTLFGMDEPDIVLLNR